MATPRASWPAGNTAGQKHSYGVFYDPATGRLQVARDGVTLGSWTDATPLTSGAYVSLRTDATSAQFDDIAVSDISKYYVSGGQRVAVRKNGALSYLLSDHLGSTSVTTSSGGSETAELWYKPWGEYRGAAGTTPTTYRYTGQRADASTGLYFYNARYYDAYLNRWIQPDTIVPDPGNPQSLNRYSYVRNNPLRYTDPTGNRECEDDNCLRAGPVIIKPPTFTQRAKWILEGLGGKNDLEAMARIADVAARLYPTWNQFLPEMGKVFTGSPEYGTLGLIAPGFSSMLGLGEGGCAGVGREPRDCPTNTSYFLDTGFHFDFQDRHNQPYHVWGYIAQTATPGDVLGFELNKILSDWANLMHEQVQSAVNLDGGWGTSWQDWVLSEAGVYIGYQITYGLIASPSGLGDALRRQLGPSGPGSNGRLQELERTFGRLRGSP